MLYSVDALLWRSDEKATTYCKPCCVLMSDFSLTVFGKAPPYDVSLFSDTYRGDPKYESVWSLWHM